MYNWKHISHFLYGKGFWYADPIREIEDLSIFEYFACPVKSLPRWISFLSNGGLLLIGRVSRVI